VVADFIEPQVNHVTNEIVVKQSPAFPSY
ncbi:uncharacterized protein METZ01_LOCUS277341, partial [marine metagenome]